MNLCGYLFCVKSSNLYKQSEVKVDVESEHVVIENCNAVGDAAAGADIINDLEEKLRNGEKEKNELDEKLEGLKNSTAELSEKIQNEEIERNILKAKLNTFQSGEKESLVRIIDAERSEIKRLQEELMSLEENNDKDELTLRVADQKIQLERLQQKSAHEEELSKLRDEVEVHEKKKNELKESLHKLTNELQDMEERNTEKENKKTTMQRRSEELNREMLELRDNVKVKESEKNTLSREKSLIDKRNTTVKGQIRVSKTENEQLKGQISELANNRATLDGEYNHLKCCEMLENEKRELQNDFKRVQSEKLELSQQIEGLKKQIDDHKEKEILRNKENDDNDSPQSDEGLFNVEIKRKNDTKKASNDGKREEADKKVSFEDSLDKNDKPAEDILELNLVVKQMEEKKYNDKSNENELGITSSEDSYGMSVEELEKIAQSTYRYSYHQYVENFKDDEESDDE